MDDFLHSGGLLRRNALIHRFTASIILLMVLTTTGFSQRGSYEIIQGDPMYYVLPKDRISAIDDPKFKSVEEAEKFMRDDELVLGLVVNGEARAYSTWHLDKHEIVNDFIGDTYVTVSW